MTWTGPVLSLGFCVALIVLLVTLILGFLKIMDLPQVLIISAICAVRL